MTTSALTGPAPDTAPDTTPDTAPDTAPRPAGGSDPRPRLHHALDAAAVVIDGIPAGALSQPTPCPEFTVRDLVRHLLAALGRCAGAGRGEDVTVLGDTSGISDDALAQEWAAAAREAQDAWADPRLLGRLTTLPFATVPGAAVVAIYTAEVLVHTWDLARATGQVPDLDATMVEAALAASRFGLAEEPRGGDIPFGPVVPTSPDAPVLDRLAAWQGRDPAWAPAA